MYKINNSVGRRGINKDPDVRIVQALLNRHIVPPSRLLGVDGLAGSKTVTAIYAFQHRLGMHKPDGLVTPAGRTFSALCSFPGSVPITEQILNTYSDLSKFMNNFVADMGNTVENTLKSIGLSPDNNSQSNQSRIQLPMVALPASPSGAIAWGAKVSPEFKKRVIEICNELGMNPDFLMVCMAFETGGTFKASQPNNDGGGAIGLIQFTKIAIDDLNRIYKYKPLLTRDRLAAMSDVEQLEYVRLYFSGYKGKLNSLEDIYMVIILVLSAVGKGPDGAVYKKGAQKHPEFYEKNKKLDKDNDGIITLRECSVVLNIRYKQGLSKGYFG